MKDGELLSAIEAQRDVMVSVATGGIRIQEVNSEYKKRRAIISRELVRRKIVDPNPFDDLWEWYGRWSGGEMPSYALRRSYVSQMYKALVNQLRDYIGANSSRIFEVPTGWVRIDRVIADIGVSLEQAKNEEQFQAVGLLCREVIISLAEAVYDPQLYPPIDGVEPSRTDAKRMLEAYLAVELEGNVNEEARKYAKASLALANTLVHQRTATYRSAALCAEAATSLMNIIAILSGRRDREV